MEKFLTPLCILPVNAASFHQICNLLAKLQAAVGHLESIFIELGVPTHDPNGAFRSTDALIYDIAETLKEGGTL